MQETWARSLGREDPLEKGMAAHSSIPAWRIPWTEPGGLQSMGVVQSQTQLSLSHFLWKLLLLLSCFSRCPTLCDPIDSSPLGSSVPGILQTRILEWVAISFSSACMDAKSLQPCPTLGDPVDRSPPGSSVHRIL